MKNWIKFGTVIGAVVLFACNENKDANTDAATSTTDGAAAEPKKLNFTLVKVYPHDTANYTQGLQWYHGKLYESTGLEGFSKVAQINAATGKAVQQTKLPNTIFGEGITVLNNKIYNLTWQNNVVYVYDATTLKKIQEFSWPYEGWGITNDGTNLIISTGTNNLYVVNPANFSILKTVGVYNNYGPIANLNELEWVNGFVWANQYQTNKIHKIDINSGRVVAYLDLAGIREQNNLPYANDDEEKGNFLNGIAYDSAKGNFWLTGKRWQNYFEVKVGE